MENTLEFIRKFPFNLDDEAVKWVENTYNKMTIDERLGQLFSPIVFTSDEKELSDLVKNKHIGGVLYRPGVGADIQQNHRVLQNNAKVPLLLSANLEFGGTGSVVDGTYYGRQMLIGATGDINKAYELGKVSCAEGAAVGVNWSFAPVVDIDYNCLNPITNVRAYGSSVELVSEMGKAYIRGAKECDVATAVKHFPGDGVDDRDQHLLTSVNSLSVEEWDKTFGEVYRQMIQEGTLTVMAGHIAFPAYEEKVNGKATEKIVPATLSENLLQKLLRDELGFNGMICSDATPMVGFTAMEKRSIAVPKAIEAGCDMFLFNKNLDEDLVYMKKGYENGILSEKRLKEANYRILATKAALNLHKKQAEGTLVPNESALKILGNDEFTKLAADCADQGVTLVKDTQYLLPISPSKHKRVLLQILGDYPSNDEVYNRFEELLVKEGFDVEKYVNEDFTKPLDTVETFKSKYDLVMYIGNIENASNKTVTRINWFTFFGQGNNVPWFVEEVPTLFVSVGNPYHLLDVPMIKTYINGYCNSKFVIDTTVEKLMGRSRFKGISTVDAFCGRIDTRF